MKSHLNIRALAAIVFREKYPNLERSASFLLSVTALKFLFQLSFNSYVPYVSFSGTGECSNPCGAFGYCNKINKSCDCEFGFAMKENTCTGI